MRSSSSGARSGNARPGVHCGARSARGGIRGVTALWPPPGHARAAVAVGPGDGVDTHWPRGQAMPGPGELPAQQPGLIIGREAALARLRGLVNPAPQASQVLVVTGEAGMGKTVLLADTAGRARRAGLRVLSVTGRESESRLAFAGLHQLLRPALPDAAGLPARQAR